MAFDFHSFAFLSIHLKLIACMLVHCRWFDSGSSWAACPQADPRLNFPADLYLEGSDQHRGWFQSSLLTSVAVNGHAPYKNVLTHGFVLDEKVQSYLKMYLGLVWVFLQSYWTTTEIGIYSAASMHRTPSVPSSNLDIQSQFLTMVLLLHSKAWESCQRLIFRARHMSFLVSPRASKLQPWMMTGTESFFVDLSLASNWYHSYCCVIWRTRLHVMLDMSRESISVLKKSWVVRSPLKCDFQAEQCASLTVAYMQICKLLGSSKHSIHIVFLAAYSEIHRQRCLIKSFPLYTKIKKPASIQQALPFLMAFDLQGIKMSKSIGNVTDPLVVIEGGKDQKKEPPLGADVLRLWVASVDYQGDVLIGPTIMTQVYYQYQIFCCLILMW